MGTLVRLILLAVLSGPAAIATAAEPATDITLTTDDEGRRVFELRGVGGRHAAANVSAKEIFAVYAIFDSELANPPPLAGSLAALSDGLRFTPRYPLEPGMRYRAVFRDGNQNISEEFAIPAREAPAARLRAIYPTARVLPQNQLKFYLQFTAPMSRGDAYRHLALLDAKGMVVDLPFLELSEELWNPRGDRLTLLLDPARVKNGLKPREESGPVLNIGRRYTLLVRRDFRDAAGRPLADDFRKEFTVRQPDETCPQPKLWQLRVPHARTQEPLVVRFGEPLDRALLERMLWIVDDAGQEVLGTGTVGSEESSWRFQPQESWLTGRFRLMADTQLEDLAGNSIARKFELDGFRGAESNTEEDTAAVEFEITLRETGRR
jgi:hypothetical protein